MEEYKGSITAQITKSTLEYTSQVEGMALSKWGFNKADVEKALSELQRYRDTGLIPEEITDLQKTYNLRENCFKQMKSKYENLLKMWEAGCNGYADLWKELYEYQDAEEQGLLLRLPTPIGTTCYRVVKRNYGGCFIRTVEFKLTDLTDFGKAVFLTKEEAESALKGGSL